ncbi:MAG: hypothetical protein ACTSRA_06510, partial [Promethearchaeota archaeon]
KKGKGAAAYEELEAEKELPIKEVQKRLRHLFVFDKEKSLCLFYQPFRDVDLIEPQLIGGFISAITSFGGQFDKEAKLRTLEYQSFKILLEETEMGRYTLLIEGEDHKTIHDLFNEFIMKFESEYIEEMEKFVGNTEGFKDAYKIVQDTFQIEVKPITQNNAKVIFKKAAEIEKQKKEKIQGDAKQVAQIKTFHLYCANCKEWKPQKTKTKISGNEKCEKCNQILYFVPICPKCGHRTIKPVTEFNKFKANPDKCEKCDNLMYIQ